MDSIFNQDFPIRSIGPNEFPGLLSHTPKLPDFLRVRGTLPPSTHTYITVVGSRKHTDYGKEACETLIRGLAGLPVVIVSGLALGIDSIVHRTALDMGLLTIAVPGSGLDDSVLYPATHINLAHEILGRGGTLLSPFPDTTIAAPWTFPTRNGIMAGISHATLVIEAESKSGTLITSRHATDLSRNVLAVPGSIFSRQSDGPNQLIREGAEPITSASELREALGFSNASPIQANLLAKTERGVSETDNLSESESNLLRIIGESTLSRDELFEASGESIVNFNIILSTLEIRGTIKAFGNGFRIS